MSTDFTRGPWHRSGCTVYALNEQSTCNRFSALVQDAHSTREELLSVAKMMQAAPDLFEALRQITREYRRIRSADMPHEETENIVCVEAALKAMAKATA